MLRRTPTAQQISKATQKQNGDLKVFYLFFIRTITMSIKENSLQIIFWEIYVCTL